MRRADLDSLRGECGQRDRGQAHEQEAADALEQGNGATLPRCAHRRAERHARRRLPQALSRLPPRERRRCNRSRRVMNPTALHTPKVEASIGRYKRVIGDALRSRTGRTEATEVAIAAAALNRMLASGRANYVRIT